MTYSKIVGTGSYVPDRVLTNADLEKIVDTTEEWIIQRTGMKERHIIAENQTLSDMATMAAKRAIEAAAIDKKDIDLVICGTIAGDYITPSVACLMQKNLELQSCPAFDMSAGCSGFMYGLSVADQYLKTGMAKTVLLVACEALSKLTDWTDRSTCVLFGDGAGAVILQRSDEPGIYSTEIGADGNYNQLLTVASPLYPKFGDPYVRMKGNELFKIAVTKLGDAATNMLKNNDMDVSHVDWLVPHQANLRIIKSVAKRIKLPMEKVMLTIQDHGNTSAASVPLALDAGVKSGKIKPGDVVLMDAFGAGLTWGAALVKM